MTINVKKNTYGIDWQALWRYFSDSKSAIVTGLIMAVLQAVPVVGMALVIRALFDIAIPAQSHFQLLLLCLAIFVLGLLRASLAMGTAYINLKVSKEVIASIRNDLTKKILQRPLHLGSNCSASTLHNVLVQDTQRVDIMFNAAITHVLPALISSAALLVLLLLISWQLAFLLLICGPLIFLLNRYTRELTKQSIKEDHYAFLMFTKHSWFSVTARKLIEEKSAAGLILQRQARLTKILMLRSRKMAWRIFSFNNNLGNIIALAVLCSTLGVGGSMVLQGHISMGEFLGFCAALALLRQQIAVFNNSLPNVLSGRESLIAVQELLAQSYSNTSSGKQKIIFSGKITIDSVCYDHGQHKVLDGCSLSIAAGTTNALSGPNGEGKTTLIDLIIGHVKPKKGAIYADDVAYDNLDIGSFRQQIGVVPQQPLLFAGSVLDNITFPVKYVSVDKVIPIAHMVGLHQFIEKLPQGYQTQITENGTVLSGGQRQCIAIARALFRKHSLLILDEPSNHLDAVIVKKVISNITHLPHKPSILLITHDEGIANSLDHHFQLKDKRLCKIK